MIIQVHKEYTRAFLLETTKLTRLLDTIHERLGDLQCSTAHDHFEVFLSGKRREELTSVDDVLALPNSLKQRIERLVITCSAGRKGAARLENEIRVDFAGKGSASASNTKVVAISVRSDAVGWPNRTLSEVEEQVERTWLPNLQPIITLSGLLICALIVLLFQLAGLPTERSTLDVVRTMWLRGPDLDHGVAVIGVLANFLTMGINSWLRAE